MSDHFHIVSALCRQIVKEGASPATLAQIERLKDAMKKDEQTKEANILDKLIAKANQDSALIPSRIQLSRCGLLSGQPLTPNTKVPSDKETGAALCEVIWPEDNNKLPPPVLDNDLNRVIRGLIAEWDNIEKLQKVGVTPALTTLLFGAPGTGKTKLAHYIASTLNLPLIVARLDALVSSLLGTSSRNITTLFEFASRHQCILLLDEFDAVAKARDDHQEVGEIKRIVNTLLQCLDSRSQNGITIAITNHETLLDAAVWRRFSTRIFVPRPNSEARREIIGLYIHPLAIKDIESDFLVWLTDGYTGSDIENMSNAIKRYSVTSHEKEKGFLGAVRSFLLTSSGLAVDEKRDLVLSSDEGLAKALHSCGIHQKGLAQIFNKHPSTISRWISESKAQA